MLNKAVPAGDLSEKDRTGHMKVTGPVRFWELFQAELATVLFVNPLFSVTCVPIIIIKTERLILRILKQSISCAS